MALVILPGLNNLIEDISRDKNLSSRIHFYGYVTHDNIKSYYSKAHVLIVPSMFEDSSPNVVIEARYLGLPVVAFPAGGISELVMHKKTGYLCNESSDFITGQTIHVNGGSYFS